MRCTFRNSSGTMLAVAFARNDHNGWCMHRASLCIWNMMKQNINVSKPDISVEVPCCLMCVEFHPDMPNIVAGGLFNGEIRVWDVSNSEEPLLMSSVIDDYFHREPIAKLAWVRNATEGRTKSYQVCPMSVLFIVSWLSTASVGSVGTSYMWSRRKERRSYLTILRLKIKMLRLL